MITWGIVIFLMVATVFVIGMSQKDMKYLKLRWNLITSTREYIKDNNLTPKLNAAVVIFSDDLVKNDYIDSKGIEKYCVKSVTLYNKLIIDEYTINKECDEDIKE